MSNLNIPGLVLSFFAFTLLQVTLFRNLVLFDLAFCYIYIAFILNLPFDTGRVLLMLLAFLCGFVVDIFYDTLGIHAFASVFIAFLKPPWTTAIPPRGGYEMGMKPTLKIMGFSWFLTYALPLILLHHLTLFFIEAGGLHLMGYTLVKVIFSTLFTFIVLIIIQYLFYRRRRGL